jgi:UDP-2,3-diacylglucosamine hydrolase
VLAALKDTREAGVKISFVGGNHDAWGGRFLEDEIGFRLLPDRSETRLAGWNALIVHGDGVGRGDLGYRALKRVIRNRISIAAFRALHPDWGGRIARLVSTTESKHGNQGGENPRRAAELEAWAGRQLDEHPELNLILAGHTHTPTVSELRPGRYYVNTGDWINHFTYLVLAVGAAPALHTWGVRSV